MGKNTGELVKLASNKQYKLAADFDCDDYDDCSNNSGKCCMTVGFTLWFCSESIDNDNEDEMLKCLFDAIPKNSECYDCLCDFLSEQNIDCSYEAKGILPKMRKTQQLVKLAANKQCDGTECPGGCCEGHYDWSAVKPVTTVQQLLIFALMKPKW